MCHGQVLDWTRPADGRSTLECNHCKFPKNSRKHARQIVGGSLVRAVDALQEIGWRLPCGNAGIIEPPCAGKTRSWHIHGLARALMVACGAFVLFLLASPQSGSAAPDGIVLAPHRAIYELTLATTRGGTGVSSVLGRMAYDLTGSSCEGYTQNMRFVTRMTNQSGNAVVTDLRSSTWEEARGKRFRFNSSQYRDEKATDSHRRRRRPARHQRRHQGRADQARKEEHFDSLARLFPGPAHHRAAERGQGYQDVVPRRPLRRLGEGREGLRHRCRHRPRAGGRQQPPAGPGEECRAARRSQGVAGVDRLFRAGTRTSRTRCRSTSCRSCCSRTA